jgi:hypothetical protein
MNWRKTSDFAILIGLLAAGYALFPVGNCMLGGEAFGACLQANPLAEQSAALGAAVLAVLVAVGARVVAARGPKTVAEELEGMPGGYTGDRRSMETASRASGGRDGVPEAITISQEFEIDLPEDEMSYRDEDVDALVNYVEEQEADREQADRPARRPARREPAAVGGFYCPPGMEDAPVLYVDSAHDAAGEDGARDDRVDNPGRPFATIGAALEAARALASKRRCRVQVRVMPGVYQEALLVSGQVALVNHRLPAEGSVRQHLDWLVAQQEVDHPDRVTILAPAEASCAVEFERGQDQGIFGFHVVGREGVEQTGIVARDCQSLAIVHCAVDDFSGGGAQLTGCGGSLPKTAVQVVGCRFRDNSASRGGALNIDGGTARVEKTRFVANAASVGGALYAADMLGPLHLVEVGFRKNKAHSKDRLTVRPEVVRLRDWPQGTGQGGAVAISHSKAKLAGCKFIENAAVNTGGALAILGAQVVLNSRGSGNSFRKGTARVGGAIFMAGWIGGRSTLKAKGVEFSENRAGGDGGSMALLGLSAAQILDTTFRGDASESPDAVGGSVASLKGAQFMVKDSHFRDATAAGCGGAAGAINASLVVSDGCIVEDCTARGGLGGGLYCMSRADDELDELMGRPDFKLPFVFTTRDASIRNNTAKAAGGVFVGNAEAVATFPIKVSVEMPVRIRNNVGGDVVVRWKGKTVEATEVVLS